MNERMKQLRKVLHLTQQEFADGLGTARNNIAGYETGRRLPSDAVVSLICKTFNVSEAWLRNGDGEMFQPEPAISLNEYIARRGMTDLEVKILMAYLDLPANMREKLLQHFKDSLAAPEPEKDQHAIWEAEARAEAEEYYREILAEKKAEAESSALQSDGGPLMGA